MDLLLNKDLVQDLRTKKSFHQELAPRKKLCSTCPHTKEIREKSCDIGDLEIFCLEEPHICSVERDGLCRGAVEKMIMNGISWELQNK